MDYLGEFVKISQKNVRAFFWLMVFCDKKIPGGRAGGKGRNYFFSNSFSVFSRYFSHSSSVQNLPVAIRKGTGLKRPELAQATVS